MTYRISDTGRTLVAATCAVLAGSAFVAGAIAPAQARAADRPITTTQWTQQVADRLTAKVRPTTVLPDFILAQQVAVVGAHFDAGGKFTGASMEQPTQYTALDREAIRASTKLAYPPLPATMRGLPRVIAIRVLFTNSVDPAALARTDRVASQVAARYADKGTEIAGR